MGSFKTPSMYLNSSSRMSRIYIFVLLCLLLFVIGQRLKNHPRIHWLHRQSTTLVTSDENSYCDAIPDTGNIAIAVKTGATVAAERIPTLMLTSLKCAEDVMIFSDLEQTVAGYHLHDALADIPLSAMRGNSDFDFYWKLKRAKRFGQIEKMLKGARDPRMTHDLAAWTLDKYKFLHILEKLYAEHPNKDWYLLMDADTYVVWPNLIAWLKQLPDPTSTKMYLGKAVRVKDVHFAHGGSGILISQAAMYELAVTNNGTASLWDKAMHDECCGDFVLGKELKKSGVQLGGSWPTLNGEKPVSIPFGPSLWCQPVVTMHHVQPSEMSQLANLEMSRNGHQQPLTFADLFNHFTKDVLPDSLDGWNNDSRGRVFQIESFQECHLACEKDIKCFQFASNGELCYLGHDIHLGEPVKIQNGVWWRSGWLRARIQHWVDSQAECQPEFPWTRNTNSSTDIPETG